jgi:hypothetical protein
MSRLALLPITLLLAAPCGRADESPPPAFDLDDALARQSISDLISGAATAYDCTITERSLRRLGDDDETIYLVEVALRGPECNDALLLLSRHGSTKNFLFREWQTPMDIQEHDAVPGEGRDVDPLEQP